MRSAGSQQWEAAKFDDAYTVPTPWLLLSDVEETKNELHPYFFILTVELITIKLENGYVISNLIFQDENENLMQIVVFIFHDEYENWFHFHFRNRKS